MGSKVELFAHIVWGTKRRRPLITIDLEPGIYRAIEAKCFELGCAPRAIGGTADHVHVLSRIHPSISIARLAAEIKGSSSHFVTQRLGSGFAWQRGYGAFSVSADDVPAVERYVLDQKRHHAFGAIEAMLESD
ncbi:MAG: IS200/IS605 family transposase [Myxococcales bacterium]